MKRSKVFDPLPYIGPEERWKLLGAPIVRQSIIDWKTAANRLQNVKDDRATLKEKRSIESFISSPICEFYSGCDGKTLLRKMKDGVI